MLRTRLPFTLFAATIVATLAPERGAAAELRLRAQARCRTAVVTLGDVAEVFASDPFQTEQLRAIELGPAPAPGARRYVRVREVQDAVWTRGINLALHQFSGVEQVEVTGPVDAPAVQKAVYRASGAERDRAERASVDLILRHLRRQTNPREPFEITLSLADEQVEKVAMYGSRLAATGGAAPWTGPQSFVLALDDGSVPVEIRVDAQVGLPPGVVVATKSLPLGSIIHAGDVELRSAAGNNLRIQPFRRIEDVVGQETTWSIPAGTMLIPTSVRRPAVVRRGEAVTLYARAAGLRVRTTVRAREDGGIGELITVESLTTREPFYARVSGMQEAEIMAAPAQTPPPSVPFVPSQPSTTVHPSTEPSGGSLR